MNIKLLSLLEKYLGAPKQFSNEEYYYWCPFCNRGDVAKKLAIKLDPTAKDASGRSIFGSWHCWRNSSHKGGSLFQLFKNLNLDRKAFDELKSALGNNILKKEYSDVIDSFANKKSAVDSKQILLPKEYKHLLDYSKDPHYRNAYKYITVDRKLSDLDIIKYNIGYCDSGKYAGYIIIPSYGPDSNLNYFVARSFYNVDLKYKNPGANKKSIIFNELFINWNQKIILCEGVFDSIAIKRNAIPILGVYIQPVLKLKLIKSRQPVYVALDLDAIANSIAIIEDLMKNDIEVYFVKMDEKDPSEMGFIKIWQHIKVAKRITFDDLIKFKLTNKIN